MLINHSQYLILLGLLDTFIISREGYFTRDIKWLLQYRSNLYAIKMGDQ